MLGDKAHNIERVQYCNFCDKAFKSLRTPNHHTIWQHSGYVFVYKGCGKKFKTNKINQHTQEACVLQASPQEELLQLLHVGQGPPCGVDSMIKFGLFSRCG